MALKCTGFIETLGLAAAIDAADTAVKSANVKLLGYEYTKGDGMCTVKIEGDVGAVKAAIAAASVSAAKVWGVYSTDVIARPAQGIDDILVHNGDATIGYIHPKASSVKAEGRKKPDSAETAAKKFTIPEAKRKKTTILSKAEEEVKQEEPKVTTPVAEETKESEKKIEKPAVEPIAEAKKEEKVEPILEAKPEEKEEPKTEEKPEEKEEPKTEAKPEEKEEPTIEAKQEKDVESKEAVTEEASPAQKEEVKKEPVKKTTRRRRTRKASKQKGGQEAKDNKQDGSSKDGEQPKDE